MEVPFSTIPNTLYRTHLRNIYRGIDLEPPAALERHIVPRVAIWSFVKPQPRVQCGERLTVQTTELLPVGGVMAVVRRHQITLGPFDPGAQALRFRFHCSARGCTGLEVCCTPEEYTVEIGQDSTVGSGQTPDSTEERPTVEVVADATE